MTTFTLPSGKTAEIGEFKVRHAIQARRIVRNPSDPDPVELSCAMIAQILKVDGATVVKEDLEDWTWADYKALTEATASLF